MSNLKPSDFALWPKESLCWKMEPESVAENIMVILARTGNEWVDLSFDDYKKERVKDGDFHKWEEDLFLHVNKYCQSPEIAKSFSPKWALAYDGLYTGLHSNKTSSPFFNKENILE